MISIGYLSREHWEETPLLGRILSQGSACTYLQPVNDQSLMAMATSSTGWATFTSEASKLP